MLKLLKLIKPESLARARKRIKSDLKQTANDMIYKEIFYFGNKGYIRDKCVYF